MDPQQHQMLKEIHFKQAAGITEMIQGVKDNLMQMKTLRPGAKADAGLEIYNKIGGGGFGEVFKGQYKGVRLSKVLTVSEASGLQDSVVTMFHHNCSCTAQQSESS
jgi:hypothetical protein